jgi:hypothetical protein
VIGLGALECLHDPPRLLDLSRRWRESSVNNSYLSRVQTAGSGKTQPTCLDQPFPQPGLVVDCAVDRCEWLHPRRPRRVYDLALRP